MDEQAADGFRHLFAQRVVDVENGDLDAGDGKRLGGRAAEARSAAGDDGRGGGIEFHGEAPQAGIWLKGMPLTGRWSCGRPRLRSAVALSRVSYDPLAIPPVGALDPPTPPH